MPFVDNRVEVPKNCWQRNRSLGSTPSFSHWLLRRGYQGKPPNRKWSLLGRMKRQAKAGRQKNNLIYYSSERGKKALEKKAGHFKLPKG